MIIEIPGEIERFGGNIIHELQRVMELDSGLKKKKSASSRSEIPFYNISYEESYEIEKNMAVIVPVRNVPLKLIEGVFFAIPHHCLVIVVSNSSKEPADRFIMEKKLANNIRKFTGRPIVTVHQKDKKLGKALRDSGYPDIVSEKGVIKSGKGEGMILAMALARAADKKYMGFIDADNYFPGSVHEYVKEYAAGFSISDSKFSMVRIAWYSKPEVSKNNLYFTKQGRSSIVTNRFLNKMISYYTGFETEIIRTGNAGEHALSTELAMVLGYSSGYSIEPYHYIYLLENFGGLEKVPYKKVMKEFIEIYQINSRNPHFHQKKGAKHIRNMIKDALKVMYHSSVCPRPLKQEIINELVNREAIKEGEEPEKGIYYGPLSKVDFNSFENKIPPKIINNLKS